MDNMIGNNIKIALRDIGLSVLSGLMMALGVVIVSGRIYTGAYNTTVSILIFLGGLVLWSILGIYNIPGELLWKILGE